MDLQRRPELMERLAAAYALGTLRGGARRRFEAMARHSPPLRVAAQVWQERLMALTELQKSEVPDPNVWKRIENLVVAERPAVAAPSPGTADPVRRALGRWRAVALAATLASVALLAVTLVPREPELRYVAVLSDAQAAPTLLVTFDPRQRRLTLQRVGSYREAADKSLQLWALPASGAPQSLGVLGTGNVLHVPVDEALVRRVPALAVSLEPKGGVPDAGGPTGPVLFKGAVLQAPV
jgi:anti-sigma-K factor RskA